MSRLSVDSKALLDAARDGDEPTAADRARVRSGLARKIALGAAAGAVAVTATHAASGATAATGAGTVAAAGTTTATTSIGVAALGAGAGVAAAGGGAAGGAATAIAGGIGAKILVSVAIVSAVGAGTVTYSRHEAAKHAAAEGPSVTVIAPTLARPSPIATSVRPAPIVPALAAESATPNANANATANATPTPNAPASANANATPTPTPTAPASAPTPLDAELSLLQDAHSALRANDGARALRLLAEHTRRFPNGQLREESEAARVFALCELGRVDEARDFASRFLREHPASPLAPRVSRACDSADTPSTF